MKICRFYHPLCYAPPSMILRNWWVLFSNWLNMLTESIRGWRMMLSYWDRYWETYGEDYCTNILAGLGSLGYTLYALFASFLFNWISLAISRSTTHANELSFYWMYLVSFSIFSSSSSALMWYSPSSLSLSTIIPSRPLILSSKSSPFLRTLSS